MSQIKNKIEWCLRKAEKELEEGKMHRGLVIIKPNIKRAKDHIKKAEHYLLATDYLKRGNFSDISASTVFYSMYQCLLAITTKYGYESRNQECTFALIGSLIEEGKIDFKKETLNKIYSINVEDKDSTAVEIREHYQYGVDITLKEALYGEMFGLAKEIIEKTKDIIEQ